MKKKCYIFGLFDWEMSLGRNSVSLSYYVQSLLNKCPVNASTQVSEIQSQKKIAATMIQTKANRKCTTCKTFT